MAKRLGLTKSKIYKWNWDRKKKEQYLQKKMLGGIEGYESEQAYSGEGKRERSYSEGDLPLESDSSILNNEEGSLEGGLSDSHRNSGDDENRSMSSDLLSEKDDELSNRASLQNNGPLKDNEERQPQDPLQTFEPLQQQQF